MNQADADFKGRRVLVMGLGILGGGIATAKWLVKHGAIVTVTDLKTRSQLVSSIKALGPAAKKIKLVLGRHNEKDFRENEMVVVNPAVPRESRFLKIAKKNDARIENEASIFFRYCVNPVIGVTGTRGKTTTVNWIEHLLKQKYKKTTLTGNSSNKPMLSVLDGLDGRTPIVAELSSWHLELLGGRLGLPAGRQAPHVAVITNIYPDHLNRYASVGDYAAAKANIFRDQTEEDFLILNNHNVWLRFFLKKRPRSRVVYPSLSGISNPERFGRENGEHNLENLAVAVTAVRLMGLPRSLVARGVKTLPQIKFREEIIHSSRGLRVVNDTTATSPDGAIAALRRFGRENPYLIAGGTDKNLKFDDWARVVKKTLRPENLYLLNGSATKKMISALGRIGFWAGFEPNLYEDLEKIIKEVFRNAKASAPATVIFSPGAASFEKFKNEFDRGEKFNIYSKQLLK